MRVQHVKRVGARGEQRQGPGHGKGKGPKGETGVRKSPRSANAPSVLIRASLRLGLL